MDSHEFVPAPPNKIRIKKAPRTVIRAIREVGEIVNQPDLEELTFEQALKKLGLAGSRSSIATTIFRDLVGNLARRHHDATMGINPKFLLHALDSGDIEECAKEVFGVDTTQNKVFINEELATIALAEMFERLFDASQNGARIIFASSRPASTLELFSELALMCYQLGAEILDSFSNSSSFVADGRKNRQLTWVSNVGVVSHEGSLLATNDAKVADELMFHLPRPDLVVADHVFAGAALTNGYETIGLCGLESLAVAVASVNEKRCLAVPVDIDRPSSHYGIIANEAKSFFESQL